VSNLVEANAYSASLEASLTICQVIFPGSFETLIEAEPLDYGPGLLKSLLPVFERSRVAFAEVLVSDKPKSRLSNFTLDYLLRGEHATREDVFLDEVGPATIVLKSSLIDRDDLQYGRPAWTQAVSQFLEVCRPVCLTDGLQHFDRNNMIEGTAHIAIILQTQVTLPRRSTIEQPSLREGQLLG
jgi:hypothetical protein